MSIILPIKVFTREEPCTKVDIFNCFAHPTKSGEFISVPLVQARGLIGLNTPKYLLREGFAVLVQSANLDSYRLTQDGVQWLQHGLVKHLERHPEDASKVKYSGNAGNKEPRKRGTRTVLPAATKQPRKTR